MRLNHLAPTRQLFHQLCFRPLHTFAAAICIKFDSAEKPTVHPSRASGVFPLYAGFFLYGIGMGGTSILAEMIWANYWTHLARKDPRHGLITYPRLQRRRTAFFFGFLFDATKSYLLSFSIFIGLLFASAVLSIFLRPPKK